MKMRILGAVTMLAAAQFALAGKPMPEFGASVQFDKAGPEIRMAQLKGKAALIVFVQSWCGICNGWAPRMFKEVEERHGDNRGLVLIAIKTDGGGLSGAKSYLASHGANPDKWVIGVDANASFYKLLNPAADLYGYVLVGPDGDIVRQGKAGSYWTSGANTGKFVVGGADFLKECGALATVLPPDRTYPPALEKAVRLAELGYLGQALSLCEAAVRGPADVATAQRQLKADLTAVVESRMHRGVEALKNAGGDSGARYEAFQELTALVGECPTVPAATEARALLARAGADPVLQREKNAEAAYRMAQRTLEKGGTRDRARYRLQLESLAKAHEGTLFGRRAAEELRAP